MRGVILQTFSALSFEVYKPPAKVFALWLTAKKRVETHLLEPLNDVVISRIFYFSTMHAPESRHLQSISA